MINTGNVIKFRPPAYEYKDLNTGGIVTQPTYEVEHITPFKPPVKLDMTAWSTYTSHLSIDEKILFANLIGYFISNEVPTTILDGVLSGEYVDVVTLAK